LFVLTLGYSRKSVRLLTFRSGARIWAELHEKAFRRVGGTTRLVVLDNLREGVLAPDTYNARLNPLYRDVLAHHGVTSLPCKVRGIQIERIKRSRAEVRASFQTRGRKPHKEWSVLGAIPSHGVHELSDNLVT
jgi:transposase